MIINCCLITHRHFIQGTDQGIREYRGTFQYPMRHLYIKSHQAALLTRRLSSFRAMRNAKHKWRGNSDIEIARWLFVFDRTPTCKCFRWSSMLHTHNTLLYPRPGGTSCNQTNFVTWLPTLFMKKAPLNSSWLRNATRRLKTYADFNQ